MKETFTVELENQGMTNNMHLTQGSYCMDAFWSKAVMPHAMLVYLEPKILYIFLQWTRGNNKEDTK